MVFAYFMTLNLSKRICDENVSSTNPPNNQLKSTFFRQTVTKTK